jgi:hypothetical protein
METLSHERPKLIRDFFLSLFFQDKEFYLLKILSGNQLKYLIYCSKTV